MFGVERQPFSSGDFLGSGDFSEYLFYDPSIPQHTHSSEALDTNSAVLPDEEKAVINHLCSVFFNRTFDIDTYLANLPSAPDSDATSMRSDGREYHSGSLSSKFGRYFRRESESDYDFNSLGTPSANNFIQLFNTITSATKRIFFGPDAGYLQESDRLIGVVTRYNTQTSGSRRDNNFLDPKGNLLLTEAKRIAGNILEIRIGYLISNLLSRFLFWGLAVATITAKLLHRPKLAKSCAAALAITTLFMIRQHYRYTVEEGDSVFDLQIAFVLYSPVLSNILKIRPER